MREASRRSQCSNNVKQIALALQSYTDANGVYPAGRKGCDGSGPCYGKDTGRSSSSAFLMILPYVEQMGIWKMLEPSMAKGAVFPASKSGGSSDGSTSGWNTPAVLAAIQMRPAVYVCPSDNSDPLYTVDPAGGRRRGQRAAMPACRLLRAVEEHRSGVVKWDNNGMFLYVHALSPKKCLDGLSNTMFVGETIDNHTIESQNTWCLASRHMSSLRSTDNPVNTPQGKGYTTDGIDYGYEVNGAFASKHPGGANFGFGDGHCLFISENIAKEPYQAMSTRDWASKKKEKIFAVEE